MMAAALPWLFAALAGLLQAASVEPQPLPAGVADNGVNVLLDSSHQFSFVHHWRCQDSLRTAGFRVTGNQASLDRALRPGSPMRVRAQDSHAWNIERPFTTVPAPAFDVVVTYQHGDYQPLLPAEQAALRQFLEGGGGVVADVSAAGSPLARWLEELGARIGPPGSDEPIAAREAVPGLDVKTLAGPVRQAELGPDWTIAAGSGGRRGALAWRAVGRGTLVLVVDPRLLRVRGDKGDRENGALLGWAVLKASRSVLRALRDDRRTRRPHDPAADGAAEVARGLGRDRTGSVECDAGASVFFEAGGT